MFNSKYCTYNSQILVAKLMPGDSVILNLSDETVIHSCSPKCVRYRRAHGIVYVTYTIDFQHVSVSRIAVDINTAIDLNRRINKRIGREASCFTYALLHQPD